MLLEIIQTWPLFIPAWTIRPKALVDHFRTAVWVLLVDAFLMPGQVVHRAKAFLATAVRLVASELFPMSCLMLSIWVWVSLGRIILGYDQGDIDIRTFCQMDISLSMDSLDSHMK